MLLYSRASQEGRTEPGRDTPCAPTYLSGSCGQEISALSEAPDSASQVSDLLRPRGAPRARPLCEHEACSRIGTGLFAI